MSENDFGNSPDFAGNNEKKSGFEGITYFDEVDKHYITVDTAHRSVPGAQTVHFDPHSGMLYHTITEQSGPHLRRRGYEFNMRLGKYLDLNKRGDDPKRDDRLRSALSLLDPQYTEWLNKPPGYPETQNFLQDKEITPKIPIEKLLEEFNKDDYLLFYDNGSSLHACQPAEIIPITSTKSSLKGGYRVMSGEGMRVEISYIDYHSELKHDDNMHVIGGIFPIGHEMISNNAKQGVWKITKEHFELLKKFAETPIDRSIEYPLSREEFVVAIALDGMAFERWGASIEAIRAKNPTRYEDVTKESLQKAIANLIDRFGTKAFANAAKWVAFQHMYRLHTPLHKTSILFTQDNMFNDYHSDILGFQKNISVVAGQAIREAHPVVADMEKDGHGRVGAGVYNAKSIFGDVELLEILKYEYPELFKELIGYIATIPPLDQGTWYGDSMVYPLNAIQEYFPEAYKTMQDALGDNKPQEGIPGIVLKPKK